MGIMATIKARSAAAKAGKGDIQGAMVQFEQAVNEGLTDPRFLLTYSVLLIRANEYQKARELLVKVQKYPMDAASRQQLFVNYATCVYKMGELEKGIALLEKQHEKQPSGLVYETLGYLYVESGDFEKALAFNVEAVEYDDEDPICLDNLGQTYYRLSDEKAKAKKHFLKAHEIKPTQLDTLYFLALMDQTEGKKQEAKEKLETALKGRFSPLNYATRERIETLMQSL